MDQRFHFRHHQKPYPALDPSQPDRSAKGKTVLITGGGKSIGKGITESFAIARASNIVILGRELDALKDLKTQLEEKYPGTTIHPYAANITDTPTCTRIFHEVKDTIAPIDILVLNAAYLHTPCPIDSMDLDDFWRGFEINVKANTALLQIFCHTCNATSATVINISSFMGWLAPFPFPAQGYSGSKAAFDMIVGYLGLQKPHIRVFTIHPGSVLTPMLVKVGADASNPDKFDDGADNVFVVMLAGSFCVYLASPRADFLRGKTLEANWDIEDMEAQKELISKGSKYSEIEPAAPLTVGLVGRSLPPWEDVRST